MISNCGKDERGKYAGGKAGDQTGQEYCLRPWYNRPWGYVLRHPNEKVREELAKVARAAARNDHIGYNQAKRMTYYIQLKTVGWRPSKIKVNCESDCSASTSANVIAVGYRLHRKELQRLRPDMTTGNIRPALRKAGFKVLTDDRFTKSSEYLMPGDILLCEGHHVAINVSWGKEVRNLAVSAKSKKSNKRRTLDKRSAEKGR